MRLRRLSWRDVVPLNMRLIGSCQDGVACELAAVVTDDHLRPAALRDELIELPGNVRAR